jgi:hypothetical protein
MADPAPKGRKAVSHAAKSRHRATEPDLITEPLTPELIDELGSGGPWESDDEFDQWLHILTDARRDDAA